MPSFYSWSTGVPATPEAATPSTTPAAPPPEYTREMQPFGLVRPFRWDGSDFVGAGGLEALKAGVGQILGTEPGDLSWDPSFGSRLELLRHQNNDASLADKARQWVVGALRHWEPRILVRSSLITRFVPQRLLVIRIRYDVRSVDFSDTVFADVSQDVQIVS